MIDSWEADTSALNRAQVFARFPSGSSCLPYAQGLQLLILPCVTGGVALIGASVSEPLLDVRT